MSEYYGMDDGDDESSTIIFLDSLPQFIDPSIEAWPFMTCNQGDTMFYELMGASDQYLSMMSFPSGRIHIYRRSPSGLGKELIEGLEDPDAHPYFKELVLRSEQADGDDAAKLSVMDSVFSTDTDRDYFYFVAFTKFLNQAEGLHGLGGAETAKQFVLKHPDLFSTYFDEGIALAPLDMEVWANRLLWNIKDSGISPLSLGVAQLREELVQAQNSDRNTLSPQLEVLFATMEGLAESEQFQ